MDKTVVEHMESMKRMTDWNWIHLGGLEKCTRGLVEHLRQIVENNDVTKAQEARNTLSSYSAVLAACRSEGAGFMLGSLDLEIEKLSKLGGDTTVNEPQKWISLASASWSVPRVFIGKLRRVSGDFDSEKAASLRGGYFGTMIYLLEQRPTVYELMHWADKASLVVSCSGGPTSEEMNYASSADLPYVNGASLEKFAGAEGLVIGVGPFELARANTVPDGRNTFSASYIQDRQREYEEDVRRNIGSATPEPLLRFLTRSERNLSSVDFWAWAVKWGRVEDVARVALPILSQSAPDVVEPIITRLCSEYRWPIGRDNARRTLPQVVFWNRQFTVQLLDKWSRSKDFYLLKSACMAAGSLAFISWETASPLLERAIRHEETTVAKEVARWLPTIEVVNAPFAEKLRANCLKIPQLAAIVQAQRGQQTGLSLFATPARLLVDKEKAFHEVENAAHVIRQNGIATPVLNVARNAIFGNLIPMGEVDFSRTLHLVKDLRAFAEDDHVQLDLVLAWAWLKPKHQERADELKECLDRKLNPEPTILLSELNSRMAQAPETGNGAGH